MEDGEIPFEKTTNVLFGKPLKPLGKYAHWLRKNVPGYRIVRPAGSKETVIVPDVSIFKLIPKNFVAGLDSVEENSKKKLDIKNTDLFQLGKKFGKAGSFVCELKEGSNSDMQESNLYLDSQNCYRIVLCFYAKYCAYNMWSSYNEYTFGCYRNMNGNFCINCYFSTELTRCLEMDACNRCSDSMFCHNCEDLQNCMFCFNTKSKQYAIGNKEIGKEKYLMIKKAVMDEILKELEKTGELKLDIYNTLCH